MGHISAAPTREHTFRSGRKAEIREVLSAVAVFDSAALSKHYVSFTEGEVDDPAVAVEVYSEICRQMLVSPRLAAPGEDVLPGSEDVILLRDLYQDEINELVEIWQENLLAAARFRGGTDGDGSGDGGEDVGRAPKRGRRTAAGKR